MTNKAAHLREKYRKYIIAVPKQPFFVNRLYYVAENTLKKNKDIHFHSKVIKTDIIKRWRLGSYKAFIVLVHYWAFDISTFLQLIFIALPLHLE